MIIQRCDRVNDQDVVVGVGSHQHVVAGTQAAAVPDRRRDHEPHTDNHWIALDAGRNNGGIHGRRTSESGR